MPGRAHGAAHGAHEVERAVEELARGGALHDVVVRGQQQLGVERAQAADRRLVGAGVVVARRDQAVARAVVDAVGEHRVDDDRRAGLRVPQAEVPERVAGQREHLEPAVAAEAQRLAAAQADVDRRVAAQLVLEERDVLRRGPEPVGLVPAVVAGQHRGVGLDPRPVGLAAQEARARRQLAHRDVAAAVVDVGVRDEHVVDRAPVEVRRDDGARHVAQAGVDQQRPLLAHEQVLADVALAEVALDPVDAAGDLHAGMMPRWPGGRRWSELLIVDVDVHVHESPGGLAPYCDPPWDVALRNVADVPERYLDIPGFSPGGDGTLTARFPTSHEATRMVHTPEQMVSELGEIGVDLARAVPRPPAQARRAAAGRLRRGARARLQRVADRGVDVAPPRAARRDRGLPAGPRGRRARDRAPRRSARSPSTCRAPASTRCGATAATTRSTTRRRTPACRCCCTP